MSAKAVIRMPGEGKEVTLAGKPLVFLVTGQDTKHTSMFDWTLPAGFMELGETTEQGAARETDEEAGAHFEMQGLLSVLSVVRVGQVHIYFRARLLDTEFAPGPETIEAKLFREDEIPWDELAFRTVRETLKFYFADRRKGRFDVHCGDIA